MRHFHFPHHPGHDLQHSGIQLLKTVLEEAARRGVRIRLLTGDYLGITNADALRVMLSA